MRKRALSDRRIGKKSNRKIDITIIGFVAIIGILLSFSSVQEYFKASILSLNQKNAVVASARSRIGVTYQMGGTGPAGYDCSGLTSTVVREALGINLPRTSRDQYSVGRDIPFESLGLGDLVFFKTYGDTISHVGIITDISGGDIKMTHANSYEGRVKEETIKTAAYWQKTYVGAREITEATKDLVAPSTPDPTYKSPVAKTVPDEYNGYFPPSERTDPRLKVGTANIEVPGTTTKVITDKEIKAATVTPSTTPTVTATPTPTQTPVATQTPSTSASPKATIASPTTKPSSDLSLSNEPMSPTSPSSISTLTPSPIQNSSRIPVRDSIQNFPDVPKGYYATDAIQKLSKLGIINGYADGTFRPDAPVTRAELTKMVYIALEKEIRSSSTNPFDDIDNKNTLSKYVLSAYKDGLVRGYSDSTFRPQNSVTKAEGSKIILKAFKLSAEKAKQTIDDISHLGDLKNYIGYMINHELLPIADHLVRPDTVLTRAQTAYILAALIK